MNLPECHNLDTMHLQRLFDNMSECYKMFWFRAIVDAVAGGSTVLRFDDIVDDMIANAWYMVTEYKLNLGPADTLEALVIDAQKKSNLKSSEKRDVVVSTIQNLNDKDLQKKKLVLTYNVPYRLTRHYGSSDMGQIALEILGLSRMNWNSFNLYSKLPCTIESSTQIAQIGWLLSQFEGSLYDYRFFM